MPQETAKLCEWIVDQDFENIPPDGVEQAKRMFLDTLGIMAAATAEDSTSISYGVSTDLMGSTGSNGAHVVGQEELVPPFQAAHINGIQAHALDFDDSHPSMKGHPSPPILPAVLAQAEINEATGKDMIKAFALGTEVAALLGHVLNPGLYEKEWHPTSVLGHLGATTAVAVLLELNEDQMRNALGISASQAAGLKGNFGTMTKPYHAGLSARNGLEAAHLASNGFTANTDILEADFGGYCKLFQGDPPNEYEFGDRFDHLGDPWEIVDDPVGFKPYPCVHSAQSATQAAVKIRKENDIDPLDIAEVVITQHPLRYGHTDRPDPETGLEGKFSLQYCVTLGLRNGDIWIDDFTDERVHAPENRAVLKKIETKEDVSLPNQQESYTKYVARVSVQMQNGDTFEYTSPGTIVRGHPRYMNLEELKEKYARCVEPIMTEEQTGESINTILNLEGVEAPSELMGLFV